MSPYVPRHPDDVPLDPDDRAAGHDAPSGGHALRDTIDRDLECPHCGYNLRGIPRGSKCPECGNDPFVGESMQQHLRRPINAPPLRTLVDAMGAAGSRERRRWQLGLTLATLCVLGAIVARWMFYSTAFSMAVAAPTRAYLLFGLVNSVVWTIAVFLILPSSLDRHWPRLRPLRWGILATQLLWIPAYLLWIADVLGAAGANATLLSAGQVLLRGLAGLGFIALGQAMVFICEEAVLEKAAQRLNAGSWLIAIPTLLGQAFVGSIPWIALVLLGLVLIWWTWMLALYALGFWAMREHVKWHGRHLAAAAGREQRVAEKRRLYEGKAAERIRPVPATSTDDEPLA